MFNLGDRVEISTDFEGSITVAGWEPTQFSVEDCIFEVVSFDEYKQDHPDFAKKVKAGPTGKDIFLKCLFPEQSDKAFVLYPKTSLHLLEAADLICRCPINRLWAGSGHYEGCPEA